MARLSQLLTARSLGLTLVMQGAEDPEISWAATTELLSLTPYLEGGEVVLTTGISLAGEDPRWFDFVANLGRARIAAIGFGVGVAHERIPEPLVAAAARYRVALFEVPPPTPFIAVSKAVADLLDNDELVLTRRALTEQRRILDQAFSGQGTPAVLASLAAVTGAEAAVFRADGSTEAATAGFPASAELAAAIAQHAAGSPPRATSGPRPAWAIHPLGFRGRAARFLVTSGAGQPSPTQQGAVTAATIVLSLQEQRSHVAAEHDRGRRERIARLILAGHVADARAALGVLAPAERVPGRLRVVGVRGGAEELDAFRADPGYDAGTLATRLEPTPAQSGRDEQPLWVIAASPSPALDALVALAERHRLGLVLGREVPADQAGASWLSARTRLTGEPAGGGGRGDIRWADRDAPVLEALLTLSEASAVGVEAHLLGPLALGAGELDEEETHMLRDTLRVFLAENAGSGATAATLGIHRNTLRNRLQRIEALTGRNLGSPDDRAELWLALRAVQLRAAANVGRPGSFQPDFA